MYLIFLIGLLLQIVNSNQNCASIIKIEKCEKRQDCQFINYKCVNRLKHCNQIQNVSLERCKQFNCDYDQLQNICKSYIYKSILEQKIQENRNKKSFNKLGKGNHKQKRKLKKYQKSEVKQQKIYSKLDRYTIKQYISQINNTQFQQLNFIINFSVTLSILYLIMNLILQ